MTGITIKENNELIHSKEYSIEAHNEVTCTEWVSQAWCIPPNFDPHLEPWNVPENGNQPIPYKYEFTFDILDVKEVNDRRQTVTLMMYLRVKWFEPRLRINKNTSKWIEPKSRLSLAPHVLKHLWYPDLEIYGLETFTTKSVLKKMGEVNIFKNRFIKYNARVDVTFSCQMDFNRFPLDSQSCPFQIGSYYNTEDTVNCSSEYDYDDTKQRSLQYEVEIRQLPVQFRKYSIRKGYVFSTCGFELIFTRRRRQTFFQVYLTSATFVAVSWLSFIIKPEIVPGRIALLVTILLVLVNIFNGAKLHSPTSKTLNCLDLYLLGCIATVLFALIEYSVVLFMANNNLTQIHVNEEHKGEQRNGHIGQKWYQCSYWNNTIDGISFFLFPICFIMFTIIYIFAYV